jgi:RNA polymerase sigma-70 factor (ECF subfamily)
VTPHETARILDSGRPPHGAGLLECPTLDAASISKLYREHAGAITARVIRLAGGDFGLAEEAVHDAFAAAVEQWPGDGAPEHPRAWLLTAARNKAIDRIRRRARFETTVDPEFLSESLTTAPFDPDGADAGAGEGDDTLRLVFTCCHPALALEAQVALTLRTLCGLETDEIARAFLVDPTTMAQRLVRAKNKIKVAKIPYVVPGRDELDDRLDAVLGVVYLVFGEGYAATSGDALVRRDLSTEAIRLGRLVERLLPERAEPTALLALMLLHDARRETRIDGQGDIVLLEDQDRTRWDRAQIDEGLERVHRALRAGPPSAYAIQAAIAALHAESPASDVTDWRQIAALYRELRRFSNTPVVALNHAAAVAMAEGPDRGLEMLDALRDDDAMRSYHLFFAARADLERRRGHFRAAHDDYTQALALVKNEPERRYLERRLAEVATA